MVSYGMNSADLFQANDLFPSGKLTEVQVSLLALAGRAKTKGLLGGMVISIKYSKKQEWNIDDATVKMGQCVIGLQMGTNKCVNQSDMMAYGTRRHLYHPKDHSLLPMDHSTISLKWATPSVPARWADSSPEPAVHL